MIKQSYKSSRTECGYTHRAPKDLLIQEKYIMLLLGNAIRKHLKSVIIISSTMVVAPVNN